MKTALVVDDHPMIHFGCAQMLRMGGFDQIHEAHDGAMAKAQAAKHKPDLIVLDLSLPDTNGLALLPNLHVAAPDAKILVFTMNDRPVFAKRVLDTGANGFLSKNAPPTSFRDALKILAEDKTYLEHSMALEIISIRSGREVLTSREENMLRLLAEGHDLNRIAGQLGVSYKTVANLSSGLKKKLGVQTFADLVQFALREFALL